MQKVANILRGVCLSPSAKQQRLMLLHCLDMPLSATQRADLASICQWVHQDPIAPTT